MASVNINNSTVSDNSAGVGVGGIGAGSFDRGETDVNIHNSTVSGNTGGFGGGITSSASGLFLQGSNAYLRIYNSTLSGNSATAGGGAITINADLQGLRIFGSETRFSRPALQARILSMALEWRS